MAGWLRDHDVPEALIIVEDQARTTEENLRLSASMLSDRGIAPPYLIATSNYHAPRAALLARSLGIDAQAVGGPTAWYYYPSAYLREFVAVLRDRIGWVVAATLPTVLLTGMVADLALR